MSNTAAISSLVTKKALAILVNQLSFSKYVNREFEEDFGTKGGYASGDTIYIKKPPRYVVRAGKVAVPQATVQGKIPLTLAQAGSDAKFSSFDMTLNFSMDDIEDALRAAMEPIANKIDGDGLLLAANATPNYVAMAGAPTPNQQQALMSILQVGQKLTENAAPRDGNRALVTSPLGTVELMPGLQGYFNSQSTLGEQYDKGMLVDSLGFKFAEDQNVATIVNGTQPVTGATVAGAGQTGNVLNIAALTGNVVVGQKFTIAGVFAVNPQSRQSTGSLQQFTVTIAAASGATSLTIYPAITPTGSFQDVSGSPANGAALTFVSPITNGGFQANVGFHKSAFTLACVPMYCPPSGKGVVASAQETYKGFRMRMVQFYDGTNDDLITRFDVIYGWAAPYPELSCLLGG